MPTKNEVRTPGGERENWHPLIRTAQRWEARDAGNLLEQAGIPRVVEMDNFSGTYFEPFYQKHYLYVPADSVKIAEKELEGTPYEKFLLTRNQTLNGISNWRWQDIPLVLSAVTIGVVDWIYLYFFHLVEYLGGNNSRTE